MDHPNILEKSIGSEKIFSNNPRSQKLFLTKSKSFADLEEQI